MTDRFTARAVRRRAVGCGTAIALVVCALALHSPPGADAATTQTCQGRSLLDCPEKVALFNDSLSWMSGGVLDFELFGSRLPLHLSSPGLAKFWRYEVATAMARGELEFELGNQVVDANFEQIASRATRPAPRVRAAGIVNRPTAAAINRLLVAEQQEVLNLAAMVTAMNRATAALVERTRPDWVRWQESAAAGYAIRAASAISRVIAAQRALTRAFSHDGLQFGVGPVDLRAGRRWVRRHGLPRSITAIMARLGLGPSLITLARQIFLTANLPQQSYSLAQYLSSATVISTERQCQAALRRFAAQVPPSGRPPT